MTRLRLSRLRRTKRGWSLALLCAAAAAGLSCGDDGFTAAGPTGGVVEVRISHRGISLVAGDTIALSAVGLDRAMSAIAGKTAQWSSSSSDVVEVNGAGTVRARTPGVAFVIAEIDGKADSSSVTVVAPPVARVAIAPGTANVILGQQRQLAATTYSARDSVLVGRSLAWSTDNAGVATVDAAGVVSAVALGSAVITGTSEGQSASATITVVPVPVRQVVVTPSPALVQLGGTLQLAADARDSVGAPLTGRAVTWASAAPATAAVSASGLVTGAALGATTVTATSEGASTTVDVTVDAPSIALSATSATFSARHNGASPATQTVAVTNGGPFTLGGLDAGIAYGAGQPGGWLAATLDRTVAPATLTLQAVTGSLAPGTYTATVTVLSTTPGVAARTVQVAFTVTTFPVIALASTSVSFEARTGAAAPAAKTVAISNSGSGTLGGLATSVAYAAGQPSGWLTATLDATTAPATLTLQTSTSIPTGNYTATVTVSSSVPDVVSKTVTVSYLVSDIATFISFSPTSWSPSVQQQTPSPAATTISITNSGTEGTIEGLARSIAYGAGQPTGWLTATLNGTTAPATMDLAASVSGLAVGTYDATVTVTTTTPGVAARTLPVTLTVTPVPIITLNATSRTFSTTRGSSPASQTVTITNGETTGSSLTGLSVGVPTCSTAPCWLATPSLSGTSAGTTAPSGSVMTIAPATSSLAAGSYSATVRVSSSVPGVASKDVTVGLTVLQPSILVNGLTTTTASGTLTRASGTTQLATVAVSNGGDAGSTLSGLSASESETWISSVTLDATTATTTLRINVDPNQIGGTYTGSVTVSSSVPGVASRSVTVSMTVQQPQIGISTSTFSEVKRVGVDPTTRAPTISNSGTGTLSGVTVEAITYTGSAFLASPTVGQAVTVGSTLTINPNAILSYGDNTATIRLGSTVPGVSDQTITVTVQNRWAFADMNDGAGSGPLAGCTGGCHAGVDMGVRSNIVGVAPTNTPCSTYSPAQTRVVAGSSSGSLLYHKLAGTQPCGSRMPNSTGLSAAEILRVQQWIDGGAYNTIP